MSAFRSAVLLTTLFISSSAIAYPLRVWVMPNEPATNNPKQTQAEIVSFIEELKNEHGIIIENGVQDFLQAGNVDHALPIVSNIIGKNRLIEELKKFKSVEGTNGPIAVRFIRWSDAFDRLTAAISSMPADQQPDVVQIGSTWVASFAKDGAIEDISGKFAEDDFFKSAINSAHPSGNEGLYAVPWFLDARLFYYNNDMISEDTIADWEKLKNECPKILAQNPGLKGVVGIQIAMTWNLLHNLAPQLWAFGGDIIRARFVGPLPVHNVLLDSPGSVAAIKFLRNLSADRCLYFEDVNAETMEQRFLNKEVAAITQVSQFIHRLPAGWEKDFGVSLPPAGPNGSVPFVGGSHLALWHTAKDRNNYGQALSLISFLTGEGSQERFIPATGFLPARRHVLNSHYEFPSLAVFVNALDKGRSYPPLAEWGPVVENEFIRGHIWNIWHGIAQAEPVDVLEACIRSAAASLRKKVALNIFDKNKYKGLFALGLLIGIGSILFVRSRRKYHFLESQLERTRQELGDVNGERTAVEGQLLLLERKEKSRSRHIESLKERLRRINERSRALTRQLASVEVRHREAVRPLMGNIKIIWDGKIRTEKSEIIFESAVQAHRLIEHLTRIAANGITSVSCLWGYALFGWDTKKLKSQPNRLFNTAVAKINRALMDSGRPAILRSEGRKSWRWRVLWNSELFLKGSDVAAAMEQVAMAQAAKERGELDEAAALITRALRTDPKCIDAAGLICHLPCKKGLELDKLKDDTATLLEKDIFELERGAKEIERLMTDDHSEYKELMEKEAAAMRHLAGHLSRCVENLSVKARADRQPLHLADILCRLSSIQTDITTLRASGVAEKGVWATIVHDEKFVGLISIPKVQSLVNRFYNHETKTHEDPRLVQLALVLMLSKPEHMTSFENATTDDEFFGGFERQLQRQFRALEQHISLLPPQ